MHHWLGAPVTEYKEAASHHCGVARSVLVGEHGERTAFQVRYFEVQPGGFTTLDFDAGWRFSDFASWLTKPEIRFNVLNLTDKHALTVDSATTLLATKGPLDPTTGKALYAGGAYYNLLEPHTFMITLKASLF